MSRKDEKTMSSGKEVGFRLPINQLGYSGAVSIAGGAYWRDNISGLRRASYYSEQAGSFVEKMGSQHTDTEAGLKETKVTPPEMQCVPK